MSNFFGDLDTRGTKVVPPPVNLDVAQATPPWLSGSYLFSDTGVGAVQAAMARPTNRAQWVQGMLGWNGSRLILPGSGTSIGTLGASLSTVGTVSHPALSTGSLVNSTRRSQVASASGANQSAELRTAETHVWRGNAAGLGGFYLCTRFQLVFDPSVLPHNGFVGLRDTTGAFGNANPSTLTNIIGIGADSGDDHLFIIHNDGSGTATKDAPSHDFAVDPTSLQFELWCAPSGSTIYYRVIDLDSLAAATGAITTDMPSNSTFLAFHGHLSTGAMGSGSVTLQHFRTYIETDI